ncbi:hypothetical protein B0T17DRAFT_617571 [Bombardia bombarda]|uniref:Clr5 domain-containing protein n=1 Tax=Bombardia bombarda TaxID=252184 RepID=A0AA39X1C6_9PEZI|nr:hypothetical protein B0T17DRAFT_617571 [Bombardia bombarda]
MDSEEGSTTPESPAMSLVAGHHVSTLMMLDHDDDYENEDIEGDISIKDESLSPLSEDGRSLSNRPGLSARHAIKSEHLKLKAGKTTGKPAAPASSIGGHRAPHPSRIPLIPRKAEDWEPWKGILHELYITQNCILRDIIITMETKYNLKATPKMYKNQFARWNFFKYSIKRRPKDKAGQQSPDKSEDGALVVVNSHDALDNLMSPMMHENSRSRVMQAGLTAVRHFLHGYIDLDSAHLKDEVVFGYSDPIYRYFKTAMDLFDLKENIERKISAPNIKCFSDLCFLVPHLLLESNRKDILSAYLQYLTRLATFKFGKHPFTEIIASFADLIDRPEDIMRYIMLLSQVNSETISSLDDMVERTRAWARNQYLACQRTADPSTAVARAPHKHHMIRLEAQSVYWAQNLILGDPEADELAEQWLHRSFGPDFPIRTETMRRRIDEKIESGAIPPAYAKMMQCLCVGWLNDYYESQQDWPKVFEWGRLGLSLATNEQYMIWSIHLEGLMRKHGTVEEAEQLRRRRLEHEWLESVRVQVDRMSLA